MYDARINQNGGCDELPFCVFGRQPLCCCMDSYPIGLITADTVRFAAVVFAIVICAFVKSRIKGVEVPAVEAVLHEPEPLAESLEMHDLSGAQELDASYTSGSSFDQPENVIVGDPGFLFRSEVFRQVGDRVAGGLEGGGGETACRWRPAATDLWCDPHSSRQSPVP